jgi:hypothetical protein
MTTAPTIPAVRLVDLISDGKLLWVYCRECCHERNLDPGSLPLTGATPMPEVRHRMKCSRCGSRKIDTKPERYPGGTVARRTAPK